jgi:hypothetical protein
VGHPRELALHARSLAPPRCARLRLKLEVYQNGFTRDDAQIGAMNHGLDEVIGAQDDVEAEKRDQRPAPDHERVLPGE